MQVVAFAPDDRQASGGKLRKNAILRSMASSGRRSASIRVPAPELAAAPERAPLVCRPAPPTRELLEARGITHKDIKGDREVELVRRYQAGDRRAGEILLRAHAKLITFEAKKWSHGHHDLPEEDLLTEAQLAFLRGVERFNETRGVKVASYAPIFIRQALTRAKCEQGHTVYVPIWHHYGSDTIKRDDVRQAGRSALSVGRLDAPIGDDDGACQGDLVAGDDNPEAEFAEREWGNVSAELLRDAMAALPPRAADILRRRAEGETLEEIGQSYDLSRERVRRLEVLAKERARKLIGAAGRLRLAETD